MVVTNSAVGGVNAEGTSGASTTSSGASTSKNSSAGSRTGRGAARTSGLDGTGSKRKPAPPSTAPMARPSTSYHSSSGGSSRGGGAGAGSGGGAEAEDPRDSLWACVVCKRCNNPDVITVSLVAA